MVAQTISVEEFTPLGDTIFVTDMEGTSQKTRGGIIIPDDDMKEHGIKPRWGRVWRVGPDVDFVKAGEWVYIEHGRWTAGIPLDIGGETVKVWRVDNDAIMVAVESETRPTDNIDI